MSTFNFQLIDRYAILNLKDLEIKSPRLEKMSGIKARAELLEQQATMTGFGRALGWRPFYRYFMQGPGLFSRKRSR